MQVYKAVWGNCVSKNLVVANIFQNGLAYDEFAFKLKFESKLMIGESVFEKCLLRMEFPTCILLN